MIYGKKSLLGSSAVVEDASAQGAFFRYALCITAATAVGMTFVGTAPAAELEEIIVTATRRDVSLKDAPVTVSAFTDADIERQNILRPGDFLSKVSNVNLTTAVRPGESDVSMRGIQGNFGLTQPVAVVVDGVVAANPNALDQELVGIQQIADLSGQPRRPARAAVFGGNHRHAARSEREGHDGRAQLTGRYGALRLIQRS